MSVSNATSWGARLFARAFTSEGMLGVAGCAMACASGSFALYMSMHGPLGGRDSGSHYFTVFAQLTPRARPAHAPIQTVPMAIADDIDPVVTGSIPQRAVSARGDLIHASASKDDRPILPNMLLRQIDGDNALVEVNDRMVVFKIGDVIPGAGRFVALTRQAGRPALETSKGLIVEAQ